MKNKITLVLMIIFVTLGYSQKKYKRADQFFDRMWYVEAATAYEAAIKDGDRSMEVLQKAGDAYYFNTNMQGAYKWYDILIAEYLQEVDAEYIFRYAHALEGIGDHKAAKKWMKRFAKEAQKEDPRALKYAQQTITLDDILELPEQFTLKNLSINTPFSDFGPMYYQDRLVYSSAIDSSNYHTRKYHWNEQPFLDFYLGRINPLETDVTVIEEFSDVLNTRYHEATLSFAPDERKVYFTRNNYDGNLKRDQDGVNHLKLYSAIIEGDEDGNAHWGNSKELPFNSDDYSVGHPAVSPDGSKLYFVSDMPGSIGATDVFVVDILEDDTYSEPRNLGVQVNTSGREMFPFITEEKLYFASDGHLGIGGLDVFESRYIENKFDTPTNLGAPLNSTLDDFGFIIKESTNLGFVCSNRKSGKGDDDIYSFERNPVAQCDQYVYGYVSNTKTGERIAAANVTLITASGVSLEETTTGINGEYVFNKIVDCNTEYTVRVIKTGYTPYDKPMMTPKKSGKTEVPLGITTVNELIVEEAGILKIKIGIIYFDLDKSFVRNDAAIELNKIVLLMTQYPNMKIKIESHTDSRSPDEYNLALSDRRAKATRDYIVQQGITDNRIESAVGYGETQLINKCTNGVPCTEAQHQLNRRSEFIIVKM